MAVVNYQSGNNSHNDKADDVSACRTGQLCGAAGKSGKYRKTYKAKQQIDQIADGSFFPSEKIQGQINGKIGTGPIGMDSGARIQVTAAIRAVMVIS